MMQDPALGSILKIKHGFFTRVGGVSEGIYASLNCGQGSNDNPEHVKQNRAKAAQMLGASPEKLSTLYQVHGTEVVTLSAPLAEHEKPQADALVTKTPGLVLGILTADCAPVLLCDPVNQVIGAAHAGWKGALAGVVRTTVAAMVALGADPQHIVATIGPCIAQKSYDVDMEFSKPFLERDPTNGIYFNPSPTLQKLRFSLKGFVIQELRAAEVGHIHAVDNDTYSEEALFFSYRRSTKRAEPSYGRQLSAIVLV